MNKSLRDIVFGPLRGEYKSVRYRFVTLPREWLTYVFAYRLVGKSWIDFYADRLDSGTASKGLHERMQDTRYLDYLNRAETHLQYLKAHGLKPGHRLLDYGCGIMRSGIFISPFVGSGNYVGVDISPERLEVARELAELRGIPATSFELHAVRSCDLKELNGQHFDYVWAYSVLHHMPPADIAEFLRNLRRKLNPGAAFYFSFTPSTTGKAERKRIKDFYYTIDDMRQICEGEGYRFAVMDDWSVTKWGDAMAKLTVA